MTGRAPRSRTARVLLPIARTVAALVLALPLATPGAAQSRLSEQGIRATATAPGQITVAWHPGAPQRQYWCAAAALAAAQGLPQTTRLARLDVPARFTDAQFSTDPADVAAGGGDSLGRSATGLYSFPRGNSLTIGFATSLCDLDHILSRDDD
jgi:hypothetical protein